MTPTIWERTATALASLGVPTSANVLIVASEADRPDLYLVYNLVSNPPEQWADNRETMCSYRMQISIYSRSGLANLPNVDGAMTAAGFMRSDTREVPYSPETRHYGLALDYIYVEQKE